MRSLLLPSAALLAAALFFSSCGGFDFGAACVTVADCGDDPAAVCQTRPPSTNVRQHYCTKVCEGNENACASGYTCTEITGSAVKARCILDEDVAYFR